MKTSRILFRTTFALTVAASLGFGASQALAGTAPAEARDECSVAEQWECTAHCVGQGGDGGYCIANVGCVCY